MIETESYSEHNQTFKMEHFAKRMMTFFRAGGGEWIEGTLINVSKTCHKHKKICHRKKEALQGNILEVFQPDTLKLHFEWKI